VTTFVLVCYSDYSFSRHLADCMSHSSYLGVLGVMKLSFRVMAVLDPVKIMVTNLPTTEV